MRATTLLSELQTDGVVVTATPDGDLELDAPRGVLTGARLIALRQHKAEIVGLLSRRCPFCGYHWMRQEQSIKEGVLYVDTLCGDCGEIIECLVPAQQTISIEAEAIV
jgi:hypothetical protein